MLRCTFTTKINKKVKWNWGRKIREKKRANLTVEVEGHWVLKVARWDAINSTIQIGFVQFSGCFGSSLYLIRCWPQREWVIQGFILNEKFQCRFYDDKEFCGSNWFLIWKFLFRYSVQTGKWGNKVVQRSVRYLSENGNKWKYSHIISFCYQIFIFQHFLLAIRFGESRTPRHVPPSRLDSRFDNKMFFFIIFLQKTCFVYNCVLQ